MKCKSCGGDGYHKLSCSHNPDRQPKVPMEMIKSKQTLAEQYRNAQYNRNVCKYNRQREQEMYWHGYVQALSLILETQS